MGIMCTSGQVLIKAGKGASTEFYSGAYIRTLDSHPVETLISGAQALVNVAARYNFNDTFSTLNPDVREFLKELVTNTAAIEVVKYNMDSYTSRIEAEDLINILRDNKLMGLALLRDKKFQRFINVS